MVLLNLEFITKVLPPRRKLDVLRRQRLVDFLHEHVSQKVQTVSAPAGYGKTTLLVDFASDTEIPLCWYSLNPSDQDLTVFFDTLLTSIRYRFPEFGVKTEAVLKSSADIAKDTNRIVGVLTGEIYSDIPDFFILVLEDFHLVESDNNLKSVFELLIDRMPANCHLILTSRTSIELSAFNRLRLQRDIARLEISELSFTAQEVRQLLADHYKIQISEEEAQKLATASEGWIAGILLGASTSFQRQLPETKVQLSSQDIFNYLASEVYEKQPPEIKGFLLVSSTFWEIEPRNCNLLFNLTNAEQLLEEIERRNLFITRLEGERIIYRYHNLFREFLQQKLRREQPQSHRLLHTDAGSIFEKQQQWHQAIDHYLAIDSFANALKIIKKTGESFLRAGKWQTVSRWIKALPEKTRMDEPVLDLLAAESLIHLGQADKAIQLLNSILNRINISRDWLCGAKALSWRSAAFRLTGHFSPATDDIKKSIRILRKNKGPSDVLGDAYRRLGAIHAEQGRLTEAEKCIKRALKLFLSVFDVGQIAAAYNDLGIVYKRLGDLPRAAAQYTQARQYWEKAGNFGALARTLNNTGIIYRRQGQYQMALDTLNEGLEKARLTGHQRTEAWTLLNIGDVKRDTGMYKEALSSYSVALESGRQVMEPSLVAAATAGIGECYGLLGQWDKAEVLLKEALALAKERKQEYDSGLSSLQLAKVFYHQGKHREAEAMLVDVHDLMERLGDKDAKARCALHLAQISFLNKRNTNALKWLQKTIALADELGYEEFIVVEGASMLPLFKYAVSRHVGNGFLQHVIKTREDRKILATTIESLPEKPATGTESLPEVKAYSLGETKVFVNSNLICDSAWRSARAKEIFFYLLCQNRFTNREQIITSIWPDMSQAKGYSMFHSNLYRLRRALFDKVILNQNGSYVINPVIPLWYDVRQFENKISQAKSSSNNKQLWVSHLEEVEKLYGGPFLQEFYSEWVESLRKELENKYLTVLASLAAYNRKEGKISRAIELLEKSISIDPLQEEMYYELARCYLATGDRNSALRVCRQCSNIVLEEIGTKPSQRMQELICSITSSKHVAIT